MQHTRASLTVTNTPDKVLDNVLEDIIGDLPISQNDNEYTITLICDMIKYLVAIPISDKSGNTAAKAIINTLCGCMKIDNIFLNRRFLSRKLFSTKIHGLQLLRTFLHIFLIKNDAVLYSIMEHRRKQLNLTSVIDYVYRIHVLRRI